MSGPAPADVTAPFSAATASLRETAKWLVGGVTATAAGVFAGSSLTNLGHLDFQHTPERLLIAIGGAVLGFLGLGIILTHAIAVLRVENVTWPDLAGAKSGTLKVTRQKLERQYQGQLPANAAGLADLNAKVIAAEKANDPPAQALLGEFDSFTDDVMPEAGFINVRTTFGRLVIALYIGTPLALAGFGLFAWAANPRDDAPAPDAKLIPVRI